MELHVTTTGGVHVPQTAPAGRDFEAFYGDEHDDLYAALRLVTRNRHESEEIMQDAFLKLWERWGRVGKLDDPTDYERAPMRFQQDPQARCGRGSASPRLSLKLRPLALPGNPELGAGPSRAEYGLGTVGNSL
jgi:hypothetical protein